MILLVLILGVVNIKPLRSAAMAPLKLRHDYILRLWKWWCVHYLRLCHFVSTDRRINAAVCFSCWLVPCCSVIWPPALTRLLTVWLANDSICPWKASKHMHKGFCLFRMIRPLLRSNDYKGVWNLGDYTAWRSLIGNIELKHMCTAGFLKTTKRLWHSSCFNQIY